MDQGLQSFKIFAPYVCMQELERGRGGDWDIVDSIQTAMPFILIKIMLKFSHA